MRTPPLPPAYADKLGKLDLAAAVVVKDGDDTLGERVIGNVGDLHKLVDVDAARVVFVELLEADVHALDFVLAHVDLPREALERR